MLRAGGLSREQLTRRIQGVWSAAFIAWAAECESPECRLPDYGAAAAGGQNARELSRA